MPCNRATCLTVTLSMKEVSPSGKHSSLEFNPPLPGIILNDVLSTTGLFILLLRRFNFMNRSRPFPKSNLCKVATPQPL